MYDADSENGPNVNDARADYEAYHDRHNGVGRQNLLHAYSACDDPDCEIHNVEVIEGYSQRATAKAWYSAGMLELADNIEALLRANDDRANPVWAYIDAAMAEMKDAHNLQEFVEVTS